MQILSRRIPPVSPNESPWFVRSHLTTLFALETGDISTAIEGVKNRVEKIYAGVCMFHEFANNLRHESMIEQFADCKDILSGLLNALPTGRKKVTPSAIKACQLFIDASERPDQLGLLIPFPRKDGILHRFNLPPSVIANSEVGKGLEQFLNTYMGYATEWWVSEQKNDAIRVREDLVGNAFDLNDHLREYNNVLVSIERSRNAFQQSIEDESSVADEYESLLRGVQNLPISKDIWEDCYVIEDESVDLKRLLHQMGELAPDPPSLYHKKLEELNNKVMPGEAAQQALDRLFIQLKTEDGPNDHLQRIGTVHYGFEKGSKNTNGLIQFKDEWGDIISATQKLATLRKKAALRKYEFESSKKLSTEKNRFVTKMDHVQSTHRQGLNHINDCFTKMGHNESDMPSLRSQVHRETLLMIAEFEDLLEETDGYQKGTRGVALIGAGQAGQQILRATVLDALNNIDNPKNRDFLIGIGISPQDLKKIQKIYRSYDYNILNLEPVFYDPTDSKGDVYTFANSNGRHLETIDTEEVFDKYKAKMKDHPKMQRDCQNFVDLVQIFSKTSILAANLGQEIDELIKPDRQTALSFIWGKKHIGAKIINGARHIAENLLLLDPKANGDGTGGKSGLGRGAAIRHEALLNRHIKSLADNHGISQILMMHSFSGGSGSGMILPILRYCRKAHPLAQIWVCSASQPEYKASNMAPQNHIYIMSDVLQSHNDGLHIRPIKIRVNQWKNYQMELRQYHDNMIKSMKKMEAAWSSQTTDEPDSVLGLKELFSLRSDPLQQFVSEHTILSQRLTDGLDKKMSSLLNREGEFMIYRPERPQQDDEQPRGYDFFPAETLAASAFFLAKEDAVSNERKKEIWSDFKLAMLDPINHALQKQGEQDETGFELSSDDFGLASVNLTKARMLTLKMETRPT